MRRALVALLVVPVLLVAGCRGDEARPDQQDDPVDRQFEEVESTLADIESELAGD